MLQELESYGIIGYARLKAYMQCHRNALREVRRKSEYTPYCRYAAGCIILMDGVRFRDVARAYFDVGEEGGEVERGMEKDVEEKKERTRRDSAG